MAIGVTRYSTKGLPDSHRKALERAGQALRKCCLNDIVALDRGGITFARTALAKYLPKVFMHKYDVGVTRSLLGCLESVVFKLRDRRAHQLNSTGEELVLHMMIWIAEGILRANREKPDFDYLVDTAFEDTDVLMLYEQRFDGIETSDIAKIAGLANLSMEDWFRPFRYGGKSQPRVGLA